MVPECGETSGQLMERERWGQVKGMVDFDPPEQFSLPPVINVYGPNPFGAGVFIGGGACASRGCLHACCSRRMRT